MTDIPPNRDVELRATVSALNAKDDRRLYFRRLLREREPYLTSLYDGAIKLASLDAFPGRAPLLAHAVRELRRGLPGLFARTAKPTRLRYHERLAEISDEWERQVRPQLRSLAESVSVSDGIARSLDSLMAANANVTEFLHNQVLEMCAEANSEVLAWGGNAGLARRWIKSLEDAESVVHMAGGSDADQRALILFAELDELIVLIFQPAPDRERRVREAAERATPQTVVSAFSQCVTLHDQDVFFSTLQHPNLLIPLRNAGAFQLGDNHEPTYWPQTKYLAAIASTAPDDVANILRQLRPTGEALIRQVLSVALNLPDPALVRVARKARWLRSASKKIIHAGFFEIVSRVAWEGDHDTAFGLAAASLRVEAKQDDFEWFGRQRIRAVPEVGEMEFEGVVSRIVSTLRPVNPLRTLDILCRVLDRMLSIEDLLAVDMSLAWHPEHVASTTRSRGVKGAIAHAIADIAVGATAMELPDVLAFLRNRGVGFYDRVAIAVVTRHRLCDEADELLSDAEQWDRRGPEHLAMVEMFFPEMTEANRALVFETARTRLDRWIRPKVDDGTMSHEDIDRHVVTYVLTQFGRASARVPTSLLRDVVVEDKPEGKPASYPAAIELASMSPGEIVMRLRGLSQAGVLAPYAFGQVLSHDVQRDARRWLSDERAVELLPDEFLNWLLWGFHGWRQTSATRDDDAAFRLLEVSVDRAHALAGNLMDHVGSADARAIAHPAGSLLVGIARGLHDESSLSRVLSIARSLASLAYDSNGISPSHAPSMALGDPRALAVEALDEALMSAVRLELPIATVLDEFDAYVHDATIVVRAALGRAFGTFATHGGVRAESWAREIFLSGDDRADQAAWAGFVLRPYLNPTTYRLLRPAFERRTAELRRLEPVWSDGASVAAANDDREIQEATLAQLWLLAVLGNEPMTRPDSLLRAALNVAAPDLVKALLDTIANDLESAHRMRPEVRESLAREATEVGAIVRRRTECNSLPKGVASAMCAWLRSVDLPAEWRFAQTDWLTATATMASGNEWDLVRGVVALADFDMLRALRILRRLARARDVGALSAMSQHARALIRTAKGSGDDAAHMAREINSILVNTFFPDLLHEEDDC